MRHCPQCGTEVINEATFCQSCGTFVGQAQNNSQIVNEDSAATKAKFCSACGTEIVEGAYFCPNCGSKIGSSQPISKPMPQPTPQPSNYSGYNNPEKNPASTAPFVLGIIGIVSAWLLAIVGHVTSIIAICLGIKDLRENRKPTGLILGIIGEVCAIINSIIGATIGAAVFSSFF